MSWPQQDTTQQQLQTLEGRTYVISGTLETGERLPTVRQLAIDLALNPKTVEAAYEELKQLGVLTDQPGEGTFVSLNAPNADERLRRLRLDEIGRDAANAAENLEYTIDDLIDALGIHGWCSDSCACPAHARA